MSLTQTIDFSNPFHRDEKITLPAPGSYATGIIFLGPDYVEDAKKNFESLANDLEVKVTWWRDVPRNNTCLGAMAAQTEPAMWQVFVEAKNGDSLKGKEFETRVFMLRKMATHQLSAPPEKRFYICSLSTKTVVYKGQFNPCQVGRKLYQ